MENELKVYRAKHDLTQEELAREVGVTWQTINALKTERYDPSLELAFKLAIRFDCAIEDLFSNEDT